MLTVTDNRGATASTTIGITVFADANAINAPSGLTASAPKRGSVTLRWTDNSSNESGFTIESAPSASGTFVPVGQTVANATVFSQSSVAAGTYAYRVRAFNSATGRVSGYSNAVSVRIK
jgi:hypothetical protein